MRLDDVLYLNRALLKEALTLSDLCALLVFFHWKVSALYAFKNHNDFLRSHSAVLNLKFL